MSETRSESDIVFERMNEQERARAWEIFNAVSSGTMTSDEAAREVRRNERRVRQEMSQQCPPGYIWDEEQQACVLDTSATTDALAAQQAAAMEQQRAEQRESAKVIISDLLKQYGLENLTEFVNKLITEEDIVSGDVILGRIRMTDQYKERFKGNELRRAAGFNALSEGQYVKMENEYRQVMRAANLPTGLFDQSSDLNQLIGGDVSISELSSRINDGYLAVQQSNPQVIAEMRRLYGIDDSGLAAYFLDPARATPILLRQARSAQIAGQATLQAAQQITAGQAEQLAIAGITEEGARQGFQTIAQAGELFVPLPGTTETGVTTEEQIAGVFGTSAAAQQRLRQRARERAATFEAGGRFAGQGTTVTGLQ